MRVIPKVGVPVLTPRFVKTGAQTDFWCFERSRAGLAAGNPASLPASAHTRPTPANLPTGPRQE